MCTITINDLFDTLLDGVSGSWVGVSNGVYPVSLLLDVHSEVQSNTLYSIIDFFPMCTKLGSSCQLVEAVDMSSIERIHVQFSMEKRSRQSATTRTSRQLFAYVRYRRFIICTVEVKMFRINHLSPAFYIWLILLIKLIALNYRASNQCLLYLAPHAHLQHPLQLLKF